MKKIRILFILPQTQQGGAETQMLYLLKGIDKSVFEVHLGLLYQNDEMQNEYECAQDLDIINFNKKSKFDLGVYFRIARFIKENDIDIVQSFMGNHHSYLSAVLSGKLYSFGGIRRTYNPDSRAMLRFKEILLPRMMTRLTKVKKFIIISNNYSAMKTFIDGGFPEEDIHVIPNGIDFKYFSKGDKDKVIKEYGLKDRFVLGIVSRLIKSKNHMDLIKNFPKFKRFRDDLILLIIGDGPYRNRLEKMTKELGLEDQIIFTGNRKDIPDLLAAMDLFVFPSQHDEGWPNVIGEAMAAGVPVMTYPAGDIERIIVNDVNGVIVKPDIQSFISELRSLVSDGKKMKRLSRNARDTIRRRFSVETMVKAYEKIYKTMKNEDTDN